MSLYDDDLDDEEFEVVRRASVPLWKLRILAQRALAVFNRHGGRASLVQFKTSLLPLAISFMHAYDSPMMVSAGRRKSNRHRRVNTRGPKQRLTAITELKRRLRTWESRVWRDAPQVAPELYADPPADTDELLLNVQRLLRMAATCASGTNMSRYADPLQRDLVTMLDNATKQWNDAQRSATRHQEHHEKLHELALALQQEVAYFRRVIGSVLGQGHADYRQLRPTKIRNHDEPLVAPPPMPVVDAPPPPPLPRRPLGLA